MTTNGSVTHGSTVASFQLTTRCLGFCNHFFNSEVSRNSFGKVFDRESISHGPTSLKIVVVLLGTLLKVTFFNVTLQFFISSKVSKRPQKSQKVPKVSKKSQKSQNVPKSIKKSQTSQTVPKVSKKF